MFNNMNFDNFSVRNQKQTTARINLTIEKSELQNFKVNLV